MAIIQMLAGSVNGTAEKTAHAVAHVLRHQGHEVRVNDEPGPRDLLHDRNEVLLFCYSTTDQGELPRQLHSVFYALDDQAVDLSGRYYGVIALGDSGYQYFAQAGFLMENAFYTAGAKRVGDVCTLDSRRITNHPLAAAHWANEWVTRLAS